MIRGVMIGVVGLVLLIGVGAMCARAGSEQEPATPATPAIKIDGPSPTNAPRPIYDRALLDDTITRLREQIAGRIDAYKIEARRIDELITLATNLEALRDDKGAYSKLALGEQLIGDSFDDARTEGWQIIRERSGAEFAADQGSLRATNAGAYLESSRLYADYAVEARVQVAKSLGPWANAAIYTRVQADGDGYRFELSPEGGLVKIYRPGSFDVAVERGRAIEFGKWYTVRAVSSGCRHQLWLDGELVIEGFDCSWLTGGAGILAHNAKIEVDDFRIFGLK